MMYVGLCSRTHASTVHVRYMYDTGILRDRAVVLKVVDILILAYEEIAPRLNLFLLKPLVKSGLLVQDYVSIPSQARITGCAIQNDA
jgi:hypothetical protein